MFRYLPKLPQGMGLQLHTVSLINPSSCFHLSRSAVSRSAAKCEMSLSQGYFSPVESTLSGGEMLPASTLFGFLQGPRAVILQQFDDIRAV